MRVCARLSCASPFLTVQASLMAAGLCDRDILFDRPRARADRSNDRAADQDRQTAAEDHDIATIALLDAEERRAWLSHSCEVRGALVEKPRRDRLTDGKVYAADQGAVLPCKSDERAAGIVDSDIVGDADARGLRFARFEHSLGIRQGQSDGGARHRLDRFS